MLMISLNDLPGVCTATFDDTTLTKYDFRIVESRYYCIVLGNVFIYLTSHFPVRTTHLLLAPKLN